MKYKNLIDQMTLEEKVSLLSGKDFWQTREIKRLNIPNMTLSDGPHGIRKQAGASDHLGLNASVPATCFPTAATIANSWDPTLGETVGKYLGEEALAQEVCVLLGPGMNIKRSQLCGRNFEYFSEDPYLAGKMAAGYVRGIQSKGVSACPKHFAVNNQELRRMASDSVLDDRTLREIYLTGFEIAVKEADPKSIMSAYNRVNGVYANENEKLLRDILVDEWGFDGFVVSDWGASNDHVLGVQAGSHLEMPTTGGDGNQELINGIKSGKISEEMVDQRVDELLQVVLSTNEAIQKAKGSKFDVEKHHDMARKAATESIVLLKNEEGLLPLKKDTKVAIIGDFAQKPRYQGAGSSVVNCTKLDSTMDVVNQYGLTVEGFEAGYLRNAKTDVALQNAAIELAKKAEVVLLYIGLDEISESEGMDRTDMKIPANQIELLEEISKVNKNIVAVISAGSAIEMPWISNCRAVVHGYLSGQAGAGAMLQVLTGEVCPSGKLAESYPIRYEDTPAYEYFPGMERSVEYREGIYVGYRYYETANVPVLFPFGYGLSYTTFEYSNLTVSDKKATFTITNTGKVDGAEVAQLYVSAKCDGVFRPKKELKGFKKVFLKASESKEVTIELDEKAFRYFNVSTDQWEIESGNYEIQIGASVADIRLTGIVAVQGSNAASPYSREKFKNYYDGTIRKINDAEFETLLGRKIPDGKWNSDGLLDINDAICQMYYAKSWVARLAYKILTSIKERSEAKGTPNLNILFIYNMPFRGIAKMMGGAVSMDMVRSILHMVNGHFFAGLFKLIKASIANSKQQKQLKKGEN